MWELRIERRNRGEAAPYSPSKMFINQNNFSSLVSIFRYEGALRAADIKNKIINFIWNLPTTLLQQSYRCFAAFLCTDSILLSIFWERCVTDVRVPPGFKQNKCQPDDLRGLARRFVNRCVDCTSKPAWFWVIQFFTKGINAASPMPQGIGDVVG